MKDFKHTHKMHHGHHPVFGKGSARPAMQSSGMSPMVPPGGMGGIQSAGEGMSGMPSSGGMSGGMGGGSAGAGYRRGGKIMMKAKGGEARGEEPSRVKQEDKDFVSDQYGNVPKEMGLPVSVYSNGKYDSKTSKKVMDNNFYEKLKENREDLGKEMGKEDDYAYKFPSEDYDYKDKAQGYSARSQAMKKAKGGWIKGAIKHPGALHRQLGVPAGEKIPAKKLEKATHSSNPTLAKRARLAQTLKGFKK
jgi:hypothetical protein